MVDEQIPTNKEKLQLISLYNDFIEKLNSVKNINNQDDGTINLIKIQTIINIIGDNYQQEDDKLIIKIDYMHMKEDEKYAIEKELEEINQVKIKDSEQEDIIENITKKVTEKIKKIHNNNKNNEENTCTNSTLNEIYKITQDNTRY